MRLKVLFFLLISLTPAISQNINVNNDFNYSFLRNSILLGEIKTNFSLNIRPLDNNFFSEFFNDQFRKIYNNQSNSIEIKSRGLITLLNIIAIIHTIETMVQCYQIEATSI